MLNNERGTPLETERASAEIHMLKSIRIQNFRCFRDLEIKDLARVNIFSGKNDSGKTSLLEALYLLSNAMNPLVARDPKVARLPDPPFPQTIPEIVWRPLFHDMKARESIQIHAADVSGDEWELTVSFTALSSPVRENLKESQEETSRLKDAPRSQGFGAQLRFGFRNLEREVETCISVEEGRFRVESKNDHLEKPFPAELIFPREQERDLGIDAGRLSGLRKINGIDGMLDLISMVEPSFLNIRGGPAFRTGMPMNQVDIDAITELMPLSVMGNGAQRIVRLALAVPCMSGGLVLVDEFESCLHHSMLGPVWTELGKVAKEFNTQIVATTNSYECLSAAQEALDAEEFRFHRLDVEELGERVCVAYKPREIAAAIKHNSEVR